MSEDSHHSASVSSNNSGGDPSDETYVPRKRGRHPNSNKNVNSIHSLLNGHVKSAASLASLVSSSSSNGNHLDQQVKLHLIAAINIIFSDEAY